MNKRAQAQIVTTILLILIVLAAVIIVWQVIDRFVGQGEEAITTKVSCIDVRLEIVEANATSGQNFIRVTRQSGGKTDAVSDIKILVNGAAAGDTDPSGGSGLEPLETKKWTSIDTDTSVAGVQTMTDGDEVQVAAILDDNTICDIADTIDAAA